MRLRGSSRSSGGSEIKIVADTNVYISALNFGGVADEVLRLGRRGRIRIFISQPILDEIEGVLMRKFGWSARRAREAIGTIKDYVEVVHPEVKFDLIKDDEADNRVLECAFEADVDVIVTGDRHLRRLGEFRGIVILSPGELLRALGEGGG